MKGISAVIATILLLLIAIAIMGFAFGFFQRLATTSSDQTSQQLNSTTNQIQAALKIDNVNGATLVMRNTGSIAVNNATVSIYVDNVPRSCTSWSASSIAPGSTVTCTLAPACASGSRVKITTAGSTDSLVCP